MSYAYSEPLGNADSVSMEDIEAISIPPFITTLFTRAFKVHLKRTTELIFLRHMASYCSSALSGKSATLKSRMTRGLAVSNIFPSQKFDSRPFPITYLGLDMARLIKENRKHDAATEEKWIDMMFEDSSELVRHLIRFSIFENVTFTDAS